MKKPFVILFFLFASIASATWVLQATNQPNGNPGVWRNAATGQVYYGAYPPGVNTFTPTPVASNTPTPALTMSAAVINPSNPTISYPSSTIGTFSLGDVQYSNNYLYASVTVSSFIDADGILIGVTATPPGGSYGIRPDGTLDLQSPNPVNITGTVIELNPTNAPGAGDVGFNNHYARHIPSSGYENDDATSYLWGTTHIQNIAITPQPTYIPLNGTVYIMNGINATPTPHPIVNGQIMQ